MLECHNVRCVQITCSSLTSTQSFHVFAYSGVAQPCYPSVFVSATSPAPPRPPRIETIYFHPHETPTKVPDSIPDLVLHVIVFAERFHVPRARLFSPIFCSVLPAWLCRLWAPFSNRAAHRQLTPETHETTVPAPQSERGDHARRHARSQAAL